MRLRHFSFVLVFVGLAACQSTPSQDVAYSCIGMTGTLRVLTLARAQGKLSDSTVSDVNKAIAIVDPYCSSPNPPTMDSVTLTAFDQARTLLLSKLDQVK